MNSTVFSGWRKSSFSSGNPNNCVEVGRSADQRAVRDTKLGLESPVLVFSATSWQSFTTSTKQRDFDLPG